MPDTRELSKRKAEILRALVGVYIRTGEPVGSEALHAFPGMQVSSATIRNELAALEELGYLTQPHPSAGRVPTDLAYRYYVDMLPARPKLREAERRAIVLFFDQALADVDAILRGTTHLLSQLTQYASLALAPSQRETAIARADLIRLGTASLLLVVFDTGQVEKRLVDLPPDATEEDVERWSRATGEAFQGRSLGAAEALATQRATTGAERERAVFRPVAEALRSIQREAKEEHVLLGGMVNIVGEDVFARRETLRRMYDALEHESAMLRLLREAAAGSEISVSIGRENPVPEMWQASLVAAPFAAAGATGTIGVVGPMRMDYAAAISAVRAVADRLSAVVEALAR